MFMLKSLGRMIWGDPSKSEIIQIPCGELYLVRPSSPKSYSECIFKDSVASIRRTAYNHQYELVVQRAYDEGELDSYSDSEDALAENDERTFLLDNSLRFRSGVTDGCVVFAWDDLYGDKGDVFEFVCRPDRTTSTLAASFEVVALQCIFERDTGKSHEEATEKDLESYRQKFGGYVPHHGPSSSSVASLQSSPDKVAYTTPVKEPVSRTAGPKSLPQHTVAPPAVASKSRAGKEKATGDQSDSDNVYCSVEAELHLFDAADAVFMLQDDRVRATVTDEGDYHYWLDIVSSTTTEAEEPRRWLGQPLETDINPVFSFEHLSFIWNYYDSEDRAYSWLLRFSNIEDMEVFQGGLMKSLWETLNRQRWTSIKDSDQEYVADMYRSDVASDIMSEEKDVDEEEEEVDEMDLLGDDSGLVSARPMEEDDYASDDDAVNAPSALGPQRQEENSQLAVGHVNDRSYVLRGDKIGVFKHTRNNRLKFVTAINKIETPSGMDFEPSKVMLHEGDRTMVLQKPGDPNHLYRMDLEAGKVVDEWKINDNNPVVSFAPNSKFAQATAEQTLLGMGSNSLFRIDPRLSGNKLVDAQFKQYATRNDFSATTTTEQGWIAVASNKGDVRLYDRLGVNAKTALPALGEPIIGVDVTADGRWVLATCRTYLLLIDTSIKGGRNEGRTGFQASFSKDEKPRPRRLQLSPNHIALMQGEFGRDAMRFTPAKFNQGPETTERTIVTSVGPYVISWDFDKVRAGKFDGYKIKRYEENVKADDFQFGTDQNVIVALPNDVGVLGKRNLRRATRHSLLSTPARDRVSKSDIVNSPF